MVCFAPDASSLTVLCACLGIHVCHVCLDTVGDVATFLLPRGMWNGMAVKDELHMDAFSIAGEE